MTQSYSPYDAMNRLGGFGEGSVSQTFGHDRYGNHWVSGNSGYQLNSLTPTGSTAFGANNWLTAQGYDGRGNQTSMTPYTMAYDGDDHQKSATSASNGSASYQYDGDGQRVVKMTCSNPTPCTTSSSSLVTTAYVYDAMGQLAAEYSTQPASGGTEYYTADHLGSTRLVTDPNGAVKRRYDYLPFGEEMFAGMNGRSSFYPAAPPNTPAQGGVLYTGQLRDSETGLDFFEARYFFGPQARFTGADGPFNDQDASDPQSWNLYTYVRNDPLNGTDPSGEVECAAACNSPAPPPSPAPGAGYDPSLLRVLYGILNGVAPIVQQAQQFAPTMIDWLRQPRDANCVSGMATGIAAVGAGAGTYVGAGLGGASGFALGFAVPGPGNAAGAVGGAEQGAAAGAGAGAAIGYGIGAGAAYVMCSKGGGAGDRRKPDSLGERKSTDALTRGK